MSGKIVVALADGFEEIEALTPIDVLRRLGLEVVVAGLGKKVVAGAHEVSVTADCELASVNFDDVDVLILPGGMPGANNLRDSDLVVKAVKTLFADGKLLAAICAAPIVLGHARVLAGKKVTCYPGFEGQLTGAICTGAQVERDGNIITGKGPGAAFEFTAGIAEALGKVGELTELYRQMFVKR